MVEGGGPPGAEADDVGHFAVAAVPEGVVDLGFGFLGREKSQSDSWISMRRDRSINRFCSLSPTWLAPKARYASCLKPMSAATSAVKAALAA